jgi:hypothetical protein
VSSPAPPLQKFSDELESNELLKYMVVLYKIVKNGEVSELSRYLKFVSKVISPEDFNILVRRVTRMMGTDRCRRDLCSDWLMTSLYELYRSYGTEPVTPH